MGSKSFGAIALRSALNGLPGVLLLVLLTFAGASEAQTGAEITAPAHSETAPLHSVIQGEPATRPMHGDDDADSIFRAYPSPILLTIIIATTALVAGLVNVIATPWTMRTIAADQRRVADKAADAAVTSASAANENAKAAGKSAEAAVLNASAAARNSANLGIHQVARLRQDWINDLRNELAMLHSLLGNWRPLEDGASDPVREAHDARVRDANTRLARVEMLLNPRELESRRLVKILRFLAADTKSEGSTRRRRARWIVQ